MIIFLYGCLGAEIFDPILDMYYYVFFHIWSLSINYSNTNCATSCEFFICTSNMNISLIVLNMFICNENKQFSP